MRMSFRNIPGLFSITKTSFKKNKHPLRTTFPITKRVTQCKGYFLKGRFKIRSLSLVFRSRCCDVCGHLKRNVFYFGIQVISPRLVAPWRSNQAPTGTGSKRNPTWTGGCRDEAPSGRSRAAVSGRLLRLLAAAERSERTVEADAAGCAVPELHAGGESWWMRRGQVDGGQIINRLTKCDH